MGRSRPRCRPARRCRRRSSTGRTSAHAAPSLDAADDQLRWHERRARRRSRDRSAALALDDPSRRDRSGRREGRRRRWDHELHDQQRPEPASTALRSSSCTRTRRAPRTRSPFSTAAASPGRRHERRSRFAAPLDKTVPGFKAIMSLGSGFSCAGACGPRLRRRPSSRSSTSTPAPRRAAPGTSTTALGNERRASSPSAASVTRRTTRSTRTSRPASTTSSTTSRRCSRRV